MKKIYGTMIATADFLPGAKNLYESLKKTNTPYDFVLFVANIISEDEVRKAGFTDNKIYFFELLNKNDLIPIRERYTINKILVLDMIPKDTKLCLIDADIEVIKNIDHYFDFPSISGYVNPTFKGLLTGGVLIFEQDKQLFKKALECTKYCNNDEHIWSELFPTFYKSYEHHLPVVNYFGADEEAHRIIHHCGYPKPWMTEAETNKMILITSNESCWRENEFDETFEGIL